MRHLLKLPVLLLIATSSRTFPVSSTLSRPSHRTTSTTFCRSHEPNVQIINRMSDHETNSISLPEHYVSYPDGRDEKVQPLEDAEALIFDCDGTLVP